MPITQFLERNAEKWPNDVALVELNPDIKVPRLTTWKEYELIQPLHEVASRQEITWAVFNEKANRVANMLIARGIVKAREDAVVAKILAAPATADATHPAVAKTGAAAGAITDIINARALLSSAARDIVVICTPAQYATYRGLQFGSNYGADPFDGLTVLFNDTVTAPIVGDLAGVLENLPKGDAVEFKYDDKTRMKDDLVDILGRQPSAIAVVGNKFFAKVSA